VTYPYSGFASTTHTVDVKLAANGFGWLSGVTSYPTGRSTPGILMVKHAKGGITTGVLGNNFPTTDATFWSVTGTIADWNPKLVIIELGINDANALLGADLFRYNLASACQSAVSVGASIVLIGAYCGSGNINQNYWSNYLSVIRQVADVFGAVFIDVHSSFGTASGLISGPNIHPNDAGHAAMYAQIQSVVL
jgi:lysophospholipase L1-like esterase